MREYDYDYEKDIFCEEIKDNFSYKQANYSYNDTAVTTEVVD